VAATVKLAKKCAAQANRPILGVGVGSPGTVDAFGTVIAAPNLDWHGVSLQDIMAAELDLPVVVQNDANAAVIAEKAFADGGSTILRVQISRGVGAGILLSGALVLGTSGAAGEIGHLVIERQGEMCSCGKRGCLETWISVPSLRQRLKDTTDSRDEILAEAGRRLGMALAPVVAALDLQDIVLGGPEDLLGGAFVQACNGLITERTHSEFRRDLSMKLSTLGDEAVLLGAVSLVLRTTLGVS
jgi:predicted NBD/HSP70 family sugar kinase